ncbi:MAG: helix-turn-helix domain-containing protein [Solirubrobacterales bacterium]
MPPRRRSSPRSPHQAALAQAIELLIAEDDAMTQESVAEEADLNVRQVNALVRGQGNPTYKTIVKLCRGLHVQPGRLMELVDEFYERGSSR